MMNTKTLTTLICLMLLLPAKAVDIVELQVDRLPDLNIPRAGHQLFIVNGELMVSGGHTVGFMPTQTAECFNDGKWHLMQTTYTHDYGISAVLRSGKVLLAGGCEQPTGIGQTYTAELYDPQTHSFRGFGNMVLKRAWASSLEIDSGKVVIAGNWYHTDGVEMFSESLSHNGDNNNKRSFSYMKDVVAQRSNPYIFRISHDDALILGSLSIKGDSLFTTFADRLNGDTVHIPLFEKWHPLLIGAHHDETSDIGNFTHLMALQDSTGQVTIARVKGTDISLLPTASAVPMQGIDERIEYFSNIIVDSLAGRAYLFGRGDIFDAPPLKTRFYVLSIDYAQMSGKGAPLTLYYTPPLEILPDHVPVLTPKGNLLLAGGLKDGSNFAPSASVYLIHLNSEQDAISSSTAWWVWILMALFALAVIILVVYLLRCRGARLHETAPQRKTVPPFQSSYSELMDRINKMMEQQLYLNSDLSLAYIASELGLNRTYVSDCINSQTGGSFPQYVTNFRIEHAKRLLRDQPDVKVSDVWMYCGFSNEASFFRTFKSVTGMTPKEWVSQL